MEQKRVMVLGSYELVDNVILEMARSHKPSMDTQIAFIDWSKEHLNLQYMDENRIHVPDDKRPVHVTTPEDNRKLLAAFKRVLNNGESAQSVYIAENLSEIISEDVWNVRLRYAREIGIDTFYRNQQRMIDNPMSPERRQQLQTEMRTFNRYAYINMLIAKKYQGQAEYIGDENAPLGLYAKDLERRGKLKFYDETYERIFWQYFLPRLTPPDGIATP